MIYALAVSCGRIWLICRNEEKLRRTMTDEQKELFVQYSDCVQEGLVLQWSGSPFLTSTQTV